MSVCRGCGKPITWFKTVGGKSMPCDPDPVTYWAGKKFHSRIVTPNGEVIACKLNGYMDTATGIGYVPHWATCPVAGEFRRKK
jgi:hypothetical protein